MNKVRLTIEDRMLIEQLLKENYNLKNIARVIGVYPSTISREIKSRRKGNIKLDICNKTNRFPVIIVLKKLIVKKENIIIITKKLKRIMKLNLNILELVLICLSMKLNIGMTILKIN